jgi:hypothetical protein
VRRRPFLQIAQLLALASALIAPLRVAAQEEERTESLPALTAEFLFRFARFTEWPAATLPPDGSFVFCTVDPLVAEAFAADPAKQKLGARAVSARLIQPPVVPRECSVVHVGGLDARKTATLIAALPSRNVLTVGDSDTFTRSGGVIRMYVEDGLVKFVVNVSAAERSGLRLSSKMLSFATRVVRE